MGRTWRRTMTRLLLRDVLRRYGTGLGLSMIPLAYLWRSLPPWVLRDGWWAADAVERATWLGAVGLGYLAISLPLARVLTGSERIEYWRQFPIAPQQWTLLSLQHLAVMHAAVALAVGYLLAPGGTGLALAGAGAAWTAAIIGHLGLTKLPPVRGIGLVPTAPGPVGALLRLQVIAASRRVRPSVTGMLAIQLALAGLGALGWTHVADTEPEAGVPLIASLVVLAGLAAGWPIVAAQRALDRDRWYLDAQPVSARTELASRIAFGLLLGTPTIAIVTIAGYRASSTTTGLLLSSIAMVWGAVTLTRIGAAAEARRDLHGSIAAPLTAAVLYGLASIHVSALVLAAAAVAELAAAHRKLRGAADARTRLQTSTIEDDHD